MAISSDASPTSGKSLGAEVPKSAASVAGSAKIEARDRSVEGEHNCPADANAGAGGRGSVKAGSSDDHRHAMAAEDHAVTRKPAMQQARTRLA